MAFIMEHFGDLEDGREVHKIILSNENGVTASFLDLGGVWVSMLVPDRNGTLADVVLGYDTLENYLKNPPHLGAPIGRNANRIAGASFTLNEKTFPLAANNGPNNLHSGPDLYHSRIWDAEVEETELGSKVTFSLLSPDGDQGYPGNAEIAVCYTLTPDDSLMLEYQMTADADTIANFTNHSYFNLAGHSHGSILDQQVSIDADTFTIADVDSIPTGELIPVLGTPMDFKTMKPIGRDIEAEYEPLLLGKGYDHNWVLNHASGEVGFSAKAFDPDSGRTMEVFTDLPGMQFYTANFLDALIPGKEGASYHARTAYCFETQYYPNAVNTPSFPSPILRAGVEYKTTTIYKFCTE